MSTKDILGKYLFEAS